MRSPTKRRGAWLLVASLALVGLVSACVPPPAPVADLPPPPPVTPDRTVVIAVNFAFDSHRISPEYYATLDALAGAMTNQLLSGYHFDIDGHTDLSGRLGYNIALSQLRALAVANYLAARGVPRESMHVQGFGPLHLLDPVNPFSPANRRVEVTSIR
jgi:outer membrane protein OmpA-like peptidoglycan-associated protein